METSRIIEDTLNAKAERFPAPIGDLLGLTLTYNGIGRATVEFNASERYANPMGTLHGGVLCDLADAAMGAAYVSTLMEGESFTTVELKINFFRPVWNSKLKAEAHILHHGKTVGMIECEIFDDQRHLVAHASSTCMTLRDERAKGRHFPDSAVPRV